MTTKKEARKVMRNIRKATGLPLPLAANAARKIVTGMTYDIPRNIVEYGGGCGDPGCCGEYPVGIEGPKGSISFDKARSLTPERRASKPMPEKVRTIRVKLENLDRALAALRGMGIPAMIAQGSPVPSPVNGASMVLLAIGCSGNKAHKILVDAGITPPVRG